MQGMATVEQLLASGMDPKVIAKAEAETTAQMERVSPPGSLGLPPLLEAKRLKYQITDGAFKVRPAFDRILVHQISEHEGETFGGGSIIMAPTIAKREEIETPRGVIVSSGLLALDHLRSNCVDVGHTVYFVQNAPWRIRVDVNRGHLYYVMVLRDGDLIGSEDTNGLVQDGTLQVKYNKKYRQHVYVKPARKIWWRLTTRERILGTPQLPWISPDY
jgi:co-chaperonin GroES (HSP10)